MDACQPLTPSPEENRNAEGAESAERRQEKELVGVSLFLPRRFNLCAFLIDPHFRETTIYLDRIESCCSDKLGKMVRSWDPEATLATVGTATLN